MNSKSIVIVGAAMLAEQMHFYFMRCEGRNVVAFAVDAPYLRETHFCGAPVVEFDEALRRYPPTTHEVFIAIGFLAADARKQKFELVRERGYVMPTYVHPSASVAENVRLGPNTLIQEQAVVAPFVQLGDNVILCPQVGINHHARIGNHCFFAPSAVVAGSVEIGERCFIGTNATIRDRVKIGAGCVIGAGALVMRDCPEGGVYPEVATSLRC